MKTNVTITIDKVEVEQIIKGYIVDHFKQNPDNLKFIVEARTVGYGTMERTEYIFGGVQFSYEKEVK